MAKRRVIALTRDAVLRRIDKVVLNEDERVIVSNPQILLIKRMPLSLLKDCSDNGSAFLTLDYVFCIVRKGHVSVVVDTVQQTIAQGFVCFASIGTIAHITGLSDDVDMTCIVVKAEEMWFALRESMPTWMLTLANSMCITVSQNVCTMLCGILDVIYDVIITGIYERNCHILRGTVFTFVHVVDSCCPSNDADLHWGTKRQISTVAQFMQLIKYDCLKQHRLDFYAKKTMRFTAASVQSRKRRSWRECEDVHRQDDGSSHEKVDDM